MATKLTPSHVLGELAVQHDALRTRITQCERLADQLDAGAIEPDTLLEAVSALRRSFDTHNQLEERVLHPLLLDADWSGAVRVARMVEEHVEEHQTIRRAIAAELGSTTTRALRDVLAGLREHLAAEERGFLSRRVLRDDLSR